MEYRRKEEEVPLLLKTKLQHPLREWSMMCILLCEIFEGLFMKGLVTVLAIFCLENLHFNENTSTELIHLFFMTSAASNTIGSVVSEAFLGDYRTTLFFFAVQLGGLVTLTITTISDSPWRKYEVLVALILISLGCASRPSFQTFGCDQVMLSVEKNNSKAGGGLEWEESRMEGIRNCQHTASQRFFSTFYMMTKVGSIAGALISPIIRVHSAGSFFFVFLMCSCAKGFGTLAFWSGKNQYHFKKREGGDHVAQETLNLKENQQNSSDDLHANSHGTGLENAAAERKWENWQDLMYALFFLTPVLFSAALEYQTSSTWIYQARKMNRTVSWLGNYSVPPDQMPVMREILNVLAVPVLDMVIYPFVDQRILKLTNLRKVAASIFCATVSFVIAGFLQAAINNDMQNTSESMAQNISIIWQIPQYVMMALGAGMMIIPRSEFAYHEAPASMKSAINGVLATITGTGNLLTVVITALLGPNASKVETLFVFSFVGAVGTLVMGVCSETYVSRHTTEFRKQRNSRKEVLVERLTKT